MSDELIVVVTDANGVSKTLDSQAPDPADRPTGIQFSTQIQSGFYTGGFTLRRAIDRDNTDIHLGDDVQFIAADGSIRYEGYVTALPRSMSDNTHTLSVSTAGWMAHASDEPFTEIFVDRDLSQWHGASSARRAAQYAANFGTISDPATQPDASGRAALRTTLPAGPWTVTQLPLAEAWYDMGPGNVISTITGAWTRGPTVLNTDTNWTWAAFLIDDDVNGASNGTGSLRAAGPGTFALTATTATRRYAGLQLFYGAASAATGVEYPIDWSSLAVYGNQVTLLGSAAPYGVAASDVIKYLAATYCPLLDTSGVQQTTYPISHLVFRESTKAYEAFLKVNSYHLWQLAVWENRQLCFSQIDLTDWDWEIRHDEVGNQIGLQGDEITNLRNGIIVTFTNAATGMPDELRPEAHAELRDDSPDNPYTLHGRKGYGDPYAVPFPTTAADALELGRLQLLEDNQPKAPGSFQVQDQIRDRSGNYQPVAAVRAGDRIRLTSSVNLSDRPRLIQETNFSQDGRTITISVDSTLRFIEAFVDRTTTALQAAGLAA